MIIKHDEDKASISGDIQINKVGVDISNINFIITLLSTNLYSYPIKSFLRETVSNGWDSQVEAGNTKTPLLIQITKNKDSKVEIAIRDYGTGLSPERFDKIYKNIGSSTKRDSNDYIGCMGIGRFSALAVSDVVYINSYYNNTKYSYIMYKEDAGININLLDTQTDTYDNGVEVVVTLKKDYYDSRQKDDIIDGLTELAFFENIYVSDEDNVLGSFARQFNSREIHEEPSYKVTNIDLPRMGILMGNVFYPLNESFLKKYFITPPTIAIKCDIGDVSITPNREELQYNDITTAKLEEKVLGARKALCDIAFNGTSTNYDNLLDLNKYYSTEKVVITVYSFNSGYTVKWFTDKEELSTLDALPPVTLNGIKSPKFFPNVFRILRGTTLPTGFISGRIDSNVYSRTIATTRRDLTDVDPHFISNRGLLFIGEPIKDITKEYLKSIADKEHHDKKVYVLDLSVFKKKFVSYIKYLYRCFPYTKISIKDFCEVLRFILNYYNGCITTVYTNDSVPRSFLEERKQNRKKRIVSRDCVIHELRTTWHDKATRVTKNLSEIKSFKGKIIYCPLKCDERIDWINYLIQGHSHYKCIEIAPTKIKLMSDIPNAYTIDEFINSGDGLLKVLVTYRFIWTYYSKHIESYKECLSTHILNNPLIDLLYPKQPKLDIRSYSISNNLIMCRDVHVPFSARTDKEVFIDGLYNLYVKHMWFRYSLFDNVPTKVIDCSKISYIHKLTQNGVLASKCLEILLLKQFGVTKEIREVNKLVNKVDNIPLSELERVAKLGYLDTRLYFNDLLIINHEEDKN